MPMRAFLKAGHWPSLAAAFLYFDLSFMVWVILGPLAVFIAKDLALTPAEKGMMVAVPIFAGATLRIPVGICVDRFGPKQTGLIGQLFVMLALALAWLVGLQSYASVLVLGAALGMAGASFAVALPQASRWYPAEFQGLALGIAGAGNSGTVLAGLFVPALAAAYGWQSLFGILLIPLVAVFVLYALIAKNPPGNSPPQRWTTYLSVLSQRDTWLFMFFYFVTFGGFVGLASSLVLYFSEQYTMSPVTAGFFTAACVFAGSMFRPIGGAVADRFGGVRALSVLYQAALVCLVLVSFAPASRWLALGLFVTAMTAFGMGNGAVFQLVPLRFRREIGVLTGLVGMAGGMGGSFLAATLGWSKQLTGSYQYGFLLFVVLAAIAAFLLNVVAQHWRQTWAVTAGARI